jgi:uncharacterized protein YxjI
MQIKIQCECGTRFKFDVEPVDGRMPSAVQCPSCGRDATPAADQQIAQHSAQHSAPPPPAPAPAGGLRLNRPAATEAPAHGTAFGAGEAGRPLLERTTYFVREQVAMLKLTDTYDILDPASGEKIGVAREEPPVWAKWLRLLVKKHMMPTAINVYEADGQPPVLSMRRGFTFLRSKVIVTTGDGRALGYFKSKLISLGGGFYIFDMANQQIAEVKGNWKGWDFRLIAKGGREVGTVTKKWAGLGKELFTSADNYIISLTDPSGAFPDGSAMLLAAGLAIDVVFKEVE